MTEQEWLESGTIGDMLEHIRQNDKTPWRKASQRRLHLFNCACLRRMWDRLEEPALRQTVELIERFVEGQATTHDLCNAYSALSSTWGRTPQGLRNAVQAASVASLVVSRVRSVASGVRRAAANSADEERAQVGLLREIFGNPFWPLPPRKFSSEVRSLAQVCDEGDATAYAILADALAELGEESASEHCRQPGHAKGCHVVAWVLGKS